mmetsp:Transcript_4331/g.10338  ORF Transcript_4331/g.10338 Transcript_4331/m.10338 type:complete len:93 (-) Transcript_4331:1144-1422(-)
MQVNEILEFKIQNLLQNSFKKKEKRAIDSLESYRRPNKYCKCEKFLKQNQLLKILMAVQLCLQSGHSNSRFPQSEQQTWWPHGDITQFIDFS